MSKPAPTLFDDLYRATFKPGTISFVDRRVEILHSMLKDARKFVLDDAMSALVMDLSTEAFLKKSDKLMHKLCDQIRLSARLPHELTWIEFNLLPMHMRALELGMTPENPGGPMTLRQGWLLNQWPGRETCFSMHLFESHTTLGLIGVPFAFAWLADDDPQNDWVKPKPWGASVSELLSGIRGYHNDRCMIIDPLFCDGDPKGPEQEQAYSQLLRVHAATLRRVWALLATINDLPVTAKHVVPSKGFVARGAYHRFLEHKTITLHVPEKVDLRKLARNAVAIVRRRAHQVRGHWRKDFWHPGGRIWVHEHIRGDKALGFVVHDYAVERGEA